ncbi:MAG: M16 family metallopeptidase [Alphaproteobacteria bacterium]|jgi:predicted Zn-dependent peptidase
MVQNISTLPNGLRVVTDVMPELETVALGVWVGVGAMYEPAELNGISHLLEHMAFKGTATRSARKIAEEIEDVGGYINACTSRETTSFYIKVLKEDMPLAVDILADILQNSIFDPEEFAREKTVVLQEISQSMDTPDDIVFDYFQGRAYPDQAAGRPILGTAETVGAVTRETLDAFMKSNYTPSRMVLSASGNIDPDAFVRRAEKAFGCLKPAQGLTAEDFVYQGGEFRMEKPIEQVNLVLGFPGVSFYDTEYYTAHLLSTLFGGGMSSRLFQEIREKRGLVYSIYSFSSSYTKGGTFGIYAGTGEEEAEELLPAVCDEIRRMRESVSSEELARAKAQLKASVLMTMEHPSARAEQNAGHLLTFDRLLQKEEILGRIADVTADDLLALAGRLFSGVPTLTSLGPVGRVLSYDKLVERLK